MKNVLITIISILIIALIIICMVRGITIGQFQIMSIRDIKTSSTKLDTEIENLNHLKNVVYKTKLNDLQTSVKNLTIAKQNYLDLASISTDAEIQQANQEQTYAMEFLWDKVGLYATREGLALTWNVVSTGVKNKYTLNFTITGSYIGIINYVYSLENDAELAFRIENFKITANTEGTTVTATFTVSNIGIKEESITTSIQKNDKNEEASNDEKGLNNENNETTTENNTAD